MSNWGRLSEHDDKIHDELFDRYVPACGKADTIGGEILRAINRIVYRYYNDGDTILFYDGGDYNYLRTANEFLIANVPNYINYSESNSDYEDVICANLKCCLDYVVNNPQVFEQPNYSDFIKDSLCEEYRVYYDDDEEWLDDEWDDCDDDELDY